MGSHEEQTGFWTLQPWQLQYHFEESQTTHKHGGETLVLKTRGLRKAEQPRMRRRWISPKTWKQVKEEKAATQWEPGWKSTGSDEMTTNGKHFTICSSSTGGFSLATTSALDRKRFIKGRKQSNGGQLQYMMEIALLPPEVRGHNWWQIGWRQYPAIPTKVVRECLLLLYELQACCYTNQLI